MSRPPVEDRPSRVYRQSKRFDRAAKALGLRVRKLRQEQELTLEAASARMDVDLKHLQKIEAGQLNVTLVTLLRIADGLGVAVDALFAPPSPKKKRPAKRRR